MSNLTEMELSGSRQAEQRKKSIDGIYSNLGGPVKLVTCGVKGKVIKAQKGTAIPTKQLHPFDTQKVVKAETVKKLLEKS